MGATTKALPRCSALRSSLVDQLKGLSSASANPLLNPGSLEINRIQQGIDLSSFKIGSTKTNIVKKSRVGVVYLGIENLHYHCHKHTILSNSWLLLIDNRQLNLQLSTNMIDSLTRVLSLNKSRRRIVVLILKRILCSRRSESTNWINFMAHVAVLFRRALQIITKINAGLSGLSRSGKLRHESQYLHVLKGIIIVVLNNNMSKVNMGKCKQMTVTWSKSILGNINISLIINGNLVVSFWVVLFKPESRLTN